MIKRLLPVILLLLTAGFCLAQQSRIPYTSNNTILISMEGEKGTYDFSSGKMLVRYNENTHKLECLLPISNLLPANDSTPIAMAQDVFFASRYPDIYFEIVAPVEKINAGNRARQTIDSRIFINIQGINREMVTPVTFTPDRNMITFSGNFEIMLQDMRLKVPARYTTMLTGRILFTIRSARWADIQFR
ncbi:MAG: YceI family protein [Hymenobacteraceae bacterium]|nr:YceI family protein [Hymenobacteraceae bacterium]